MVMGLSGFMPDQLDIALQTDPTGRALCRAVRAMVEGGTDRELVYDRLEVLRAEARLRDAESAEAAVMDVMDRLASWCAPGDRI